MGTQDEFVVAVTRAEVAESDARQLAQEVRHLQAEMTAARWALNAADIMRNSMSETITKERAEVARLTAALAESDASTEAAALMLERDAMESELRDARSAVLLIAKRMEDGGPASSDLLCIWANELRKAVT